LPHRTCVTGDNRFCKENPSIVGEHTWPLTVHAQQRVAQLRAELEADPGAVNRRQRAAQERAAHEREARIAAAQDRMRELEAERARREKKNKKDVAQQKEPRLDD
jgi:hypothetical protein